MRHRSTAVPSTRILGLASLALLAAALLPTTAGGAPPASFVAGPGPVRFHAPVPNPAALDQYRELRAGGDERTAAGLLAMVGAPHAVWLVDSTPAEAERAARATVETAADEGTVPVLVLYNAPGRDCAQYSAGGAGTDTAYTDWTDAVARGIGDRRALVVLEPDGIALLPSDCGQDDTAGTRTAARYTAVRHAVDTLEPLAGTAVYIDAGNPGWHAVETVVPRLVKAGVDRATGFAVNVSHYHSDADSSWYGTLVSGCLAHVARAGDPTDCPERSLPRAEALSWLTTHATGPAADRAHFVTDTSRAGRGPWTPKPGAHPDPQEWCNPPGRGLGPRPTATTGDPLHDARLWIKTPGESDGHCLRGTAGPEDPERGTVDPKAGDWFPAQALELVRLADPPILPRPAAG
ncbi:glycoside hydrolase family 6 protein [Streptomyces sp. P9(2023)]|uniref:glycoside hydrolase family 6 protein n=1 Tax=Streptomyces sp. P9(2023) TaxID=3064394 RepID=UPI0028F3E370|nr:glycoside hydrolase family 6 protein [Streptomyces sp. P9(2023)]MDT9692546.1 glycoside hydrolase family 6 protein [Streptomyces sp. P9(2023)]